MCGTHNNEPSAYYIPIYKCMYIYICIHIYIYTHSGKMDLCMCVYVCVYIYIHMGLNLHKLMYYAFIYR